MDCLEFVDPPDYTARCGYAAIDARELARHQAAAHPERAAWDQEHAREIILELRWALRLETSYRERLERELQRQRSVAEIAGFWHHARGMHRAPWLNRLKERIVDMEERHPNALLD